MQNSTSTIYTNYCLYKIEYYWTDIQILGLLDKPKVCNIMKTLTGLILMFKKFNKGCIRGKKNIGIDLSAL